MNEHSCCICSQIHGDASNDLLARLMADEGYVRRVPFESESFAVIPSVGPLVEGHVLLCPKHHFKSFSQVPLTLEDEFILIKSRVLSSIGKTFGRSIHYFEHGSARAAAQPVCTVEHAHLHVVPTEVEIWPMIKDAFAWHSLADVRLSELSTITGDLEYLWYETPDGESFVTTAIEGTFESQYMRKVFARALNCEETWNWREFPRVEALSDTYTRLQRTVSS